MKDTVLPRAPSLGERIMTLPVVKAASTVGLIGLFFAGYFYVLRHPLFAVHTMRLLPIDRWVGFHPGAVVVYLSLWIYVSLGAALMADGLELLRFWTSAMALALGGLACFWFFPTAVPAGAAEWSRHATFVYLRSFDAAGNACPSLHTGFAVFVGGAVDLVLRGGRRRLLRAVNVAWAAAIVWSTLAVKQHVALDAVAGAAAGGAAAWLFRRMCAGPRRAAEAGAGAVGAGAAIAAGRSGQLRVSPVMSGRAKTAE